LPTFEQDETNDAIAADSRHSERVVVQPGVPRLLVDRYEVLEEIGSGATAVTYRGHDRRLDRDVAIKILRQDHALDSNYVQRFEREARAAASVSQGNVVDVYDFGEQEDSLYIVMQYIDGEDLKHYIARHGALGSRRARQLTTQILSGLAAIHAAGIIHRDIKPQNVLIGRDGIARVTDFGRDRCWVDDCRDDSRNGSVHGS
jgi:serine/threonine-protein kinase